MNGVEVIIGSLEISHEPLPAYSSEALDFLSELSRELMAFPESRVYPDLSSAAFWCRKANLLKLKETCSCAENRLGRGLAFHITPSNIPVNFAFSWFFSLLSGNANIIRLPTKRFPQAEVFCNTVKRLLPKHREIERRTAFVRYPSGSEETGTFCQMADARLIWGGDETIAQIRQYPTKPKCVDLTFADRYSICILDGEAVSRCSETELKRLAENFYNDTYLMDQNACSSPQLILWRNPDGEGQRRFWDAVAACAAVRYDLQGMTAVDKYTRLCQDAIERPEVKAVFRQKGNLVYRAELAELPKNSTTFRGNGGYFYEYRLRSLDELCGIVDEKYQTVTVYGVAPEEIRQVVLRNRLRGVDRVVPVGKAMDIGVIWDGYDIVTMLSRVVSTQ